MIGCLKGCIHIIYLLFYILVETNAHHCFQNFKIKSSKVLLSQAKTQRHLIYKTKKTIKSSTFLHLGLKKVNTIDTIFNPIILLSCSIKKKCIIFTVSLCISNALRSCWHGNTDYFVLKSSHLLAKQFQKYLKVFIACQEFISAEKKKIIIIVTIMLILSHICRGFNLPALYLPRPILQLGIYQHFDNRGRDECSVFCSPDVDVRWDSDRGSRCSVTMEETGLAGQSGDLHSLIETDRSLMEAVQPE